MTSREMRQKATELQEQLTALSAALTEESTPEDVKRVEDLQEQLKALQHGIRVKEVTETLVTQMPEPTSVTSFSGLIPSTTNLPSVYVPAEPKDRDAERRHGFGTFGEFAAAVYNACPQVQGPIDNRLSLYAAASGMQQAIGSQGGYLVPPTFSTTIWDGLNRASNSLLAMTDNYTITGESLTFVANAETARTAGQQWGGVRGYWIAEAEQMTASKPTFRKVKLEPQQMAVMVYCTDKLLKNSAIALEQYLTRAATDVISFMVGDSIINGTGAGQPLGILNSGALISVAKETGQTAATVVAENIVKMWARLHPNSKAGAVWFINPAVETQLWQMTIGVGTSGLPVYMPPGGLSTSPYATLLGRPVMSLEYCAALGTVGDIIVADLKAVASGTSGGVEGASSIHLRFDYNESVYRWLFSVDATPWVLSPITPYKGTDTLSPFVALATRA